MGNKELFACSACRRKFVAVEGPEVSCPRCQARTEVTRIPGGYRRRLRRRVLFSILAVLLGIGIFFLGKEPLGPSPVVGLSDEEIQTKFREDAALLLHYRDGLETLGAEIERQSALFDAPSEASLTEDQKQTLKRLWASLFDHCVALDGMKRFYKGFFLILPMRRESHVRAFQLAYTAFLVQFVHGLDFIERTINRPFFEKLLDEPQPEHGIPERAYARMKWNVIHVREVALLAAGHDYEKFVRTLYWNDTLERDAELAELRRTTEKFHPKVLQALGRRGVKLFALNGLDIFKDTTFQGWFPLQRTVSEWMGDTRIKRLHRNLIRLEQLREMGKLLQPGDILLERRNWYLSNIGLPGFWPHAALYVGTPQELREAFRDGETARHFGGDLPSHLERAAAEAWRAYLAPGREGHAIRVIESVSEGVIFNSLEESCLADYVVALRPRLAPLERARAIANAFGYHGRPYDFNFDFVTDSSLVCTELVYKSYKPRRELRGLRFPLLKIMGRETLPANEIARKFAIESGTPQQELDFVYFLDGREEEGVAVVSTEEAFSQSHLRPKWDILQ